MRRWLVAAQLFQDTRLLCCNSNSVGPIELLVQVAIDMQPVDFVDVRLCRLPGHLAADAVDRKVDVVFAIHLVDEPPHPYLVARIECLRRPHLIVAGAEEARAHGVAGWKRRRKLIAASVAVPVVSLGLESVSQSRPCAEKSECVFAPLSTVISDV